MKFDVKIKGKETKEIDFSGMTMGDQEEFLIEGTKIDKEGDPTVFFSFLKERLCKYTGLTPEEYKDMEVEDGRKLMKHMMNLLKPFSTDKDSDF